MRTYTCSYPFNDGQHVVLIEAADEAEASRRLRAIGMTAQIDGELVAEIPLRAPRWFGLATLLSWLWGQS